MIKSILAALGLLLLASTPAMAATNFLEAPGTNGYIATPFNWQSTELNGLASGACATSSVGGSSGVYSQTNNANAIWASVYFTSGGSFTPVTGQALYGWFLPSPDGGTTFETQTATCGVGTAPLQRAPDFVIPLSAAAYSSGNNAWANGRFVQLPWGSYKVVVWNIGTTALPATGNVVAAGPVAIQY